uniref:E3 ubiquitin-protein ligase n=1 Tax=Astyanax mexicanus TaxID=7994 RepID=A0A8B9KGB1_ASTMX
MGSVLGRRIAGVEDIDIQANSAYRFPPKSGNYFASHFFMGGEKFDTPHPEGYLFGENMDLNFLGNRPVQFPYVTPAPHEPVKTLRSLVNIRKDSLRLSQFTLFLSFCSYSPKSPVMVSETVHCKRGVSQQFSLPSFKIDFSEWKEEDLNFDLDRGVFPMVIQAVVDEGDDCLGHAHVLLAAFERHVDGSFSVKPLKQKQIVDRVSYLLQEIYGIENKNNQETKVNIISILINVHLHLLFSTIFFFFFRLSHFAYFRSYIVIHHLPKRRELHLCPVLAESMDHEEHSSSDSVPPGFEPISLLEALNGLTAVSPAVPSAPLYDEINFSGSLSGDSRQLSSPEHSGDNGLQKSKISKSPDSTLRSPSSPIQEEDEEKLSEMSDAQAHTLLSSSPAPTECVCMCVCVCLCTEDRLNSEGDCSSEHSSLTKTESDPPGFSGSMESLITQSTNCSSQPLLCPTSSLHIEDE